MRSALIIVQAASFFALAGVLLHEGRPKLAAAQLLLGVVTWLVYSA